jgi:two-component system response regulator RegA
MLIVVLTGFASIATAVEAIKLGACHYLAKPSNTDDIEAAFGRAAGTTDIELTNRSTSIKTLEWERIHETLAETGFNISETARGSACTAARWRASWKSSRSSSI